MAEDKKLRYKCAKCAHIIQIKPNFKKMCTFCGSSELVLQEWNSDLDALIKESSHKQYNN